MGREIVFLVGLITITRALVWYFRTRYNQWRYWYDRRNVKGLDWMASQGHYPHAYLLWIFDSQHTKVGYWYGKLTQEILHFEPIPKVWTQYSAWKDPKWLYKLRTFVCKINGFKD